MRALLWPQMSAADNEAETAGFPAGRGPVRLVAIASVGPRAVGFAEVSERSVAEGCGEEPVAFLEGWFVEPEHQRSGIGRRIVAFVEDWARQRGYRWLASDSDLTNHLGHKAHEAAGFQEVGRVVQYRKAL